MTRDAALEVEREITLGSRVVHVGGHVRNEAGLLGVGTVVATHYLEDTIKNRPSAWVLHFSPDGYALYRSVDICDLEVVGESA